MAAAGFMLAATERKYLGGVLDAEMARCSKIEWWDSRGQVSARSMPKLFLLFAITRNQYATKCMIGGLWRR